MQLHRSDHVIVVVYRFNILDSNEIVVDAFLFVRPILETLFFSSFHTSAEIENKGNYPIQLKQDTE